MLKKILFSCSLSLSLMNAYAQEKVWFQDSFDDNSKGWYWSDVDGPDMTRKISGGKYYINHKNTTGMIYWTLASIYCNPAKPYSIEMNVVQTESSNADGFGFVLPGSESKNYFFLINPGKQNFWVGTEQKGTWSNITSTPQSSSSINTVGSNNNLKLDVADGNLKFLVNGKEVYTAEIASGFKQMLDASTFGIVSTTTMKLEVDDFIFRQDNPPVNVVPNLPRMTKVNLGENVNTKYTEKWPLVAPDGKTLYYIVNGDPENKGESKTDDIYYSVAQSDSTWEKRIHMGYPLNNDWPNCVISVTPDNNTLFLMHTYNIDGTPKGPGFSMSHRTADGWSIPEDVKVKNYYNNGGSNEFCLSADRKVLLQAIQREDSYGQNDIYVSFLQEDGEFSAPKNLGNIVNTFAWEASPFLAADGKTLYYSTAGYPGYGSADIFMTRRLDSTWTSWSVPQNMGPDINSAGWEAYYAIPASGKYAYVISQTGSIEGSNDLFRIKLPEALKPNPVVLVYGKVLNSKTKAPIQSNINYNLLSTNKELGIASSSARDGSYKIVLPAGEVYSFLARKNGFYSVSENIDLSKLNEYKEIERNLYLAPLEIGETIRLNNLFFDFSKSNLRKESSAELDRVIKVLNDNPEMVIEIGGHTDNVGNDLVNNKLSDDRATAVKAYLLSKGITAARVVSKGYGKNKPVTGNETEEGRQKNRRVEFTILKN